MRRPRRRFLGVSVLKPDTVSDAAIPQTNLPLNLTREDYFAMQQLNPDLDRDVQDGMSRQMVAETIGDNLFEIPLIDDNTGYDKTIVAERLDPFNTLERLDPYDKPQRVYDLSKYGNATQNNGVLVAGDQIVLFRPKGFRKMVIIQNTDALNSLRFAWDDDATQRGLIIPAGGSFTLNDVIPQNDLHMAPVAGTPTYCVMFIHTDPTQKA